MEKSIFEKNNKIIIDDKEYAVEKDTLTGSELRSMANLDSSAELWQSIPGASNDKFIESFDILKIKDDMKFISLKKTIGPAK